MLPIDTSHSKHTGLNVLSRTTYMMTPCHHMFHTECLERVSFKQKLTKYDLTEYILFIVDENQT